MKVRSIRCSILALFTLIISHGCHHQDIKERINVLSKINPTEKAQIIKKENILKEEPSVLYKSNDLGLSWSSFDNGIPSDATLSGIKLYGNKIYVSTDYHGVFQSNEGQNDWKELNGRYLKGMDINCIEVEGDNLIIGTLRKGIFISKDQGLNWKPSKRNIESKIRALFMSEKIIFAGTDSGIYESNDMGDTWTHVFGQMQILGFTSMNNKKYAATQHGALLLEGDSTNWKYIYKGDALHDIGNDGKYIYAMTIGQQLLKTKDDGKLWDNAQNGISRPPNFYTNELQYISNDIFSAQWIGIYHSQNNGESWRKLKGLPESTAFSTLEITKYGIIAGIAIR